LATAEICIIESMCFHIDNNKKELDLPVSNTGENNCTGILCDVSNIDDRDKSYNTIKDQKGQTDILFANAGIL
jgi:NADP-dependent 3-hydroxy acid dehydrogenase YdfG